MDSFIKYDLPEGLTIPEDCAVRLLDMDVGVQGVTKVDETGFANIYINARLSLDKRREALKHELRHYIRDDMNSEEDIRTVEAAADRPAPGELLALDGTHLLRPSPFAPAELRPVGRGLFLPVPDALPRFAELLAGVSVLLRRALRVYDVLQTPPLVPIARLEALADGLCPEDMICIALSPAFIQLCRENGDRLHGTLYCDPRGRPDNALLMLELRAAPVLRVSVDLRRRRGRLDLHAIGRETDAGGYERLY